MPDTPSPAKTALKLAIEQCAALGDQSDAMVNEKWGKRATSILAASLSFLAAYKAASDDEQKGVRMSLKAKSGVSREPNTDNLPVIAVYMCVSCTGKTRSKAQRKAWCRFATVIKVANAVPVSPDEAAKWLETKTLNGILAEWKAMKTTDGSIGRKSAVPKVLKDYAHLAAALTKGSQFQARAKEELAKANDAIGAAMAQSRVGATMGTANNPPPA